MRRELSHEENRGTASKLAAGDVFQTRNMSREMQLIPWQEIWRALLFAKLRGRSKITEVFLNSLFEEAVFDDEGAWSRIEGKSV